MAGKGIAEDRFSEIIRANVLSGRSCGKGHLCRYVCSRAPCLSTFTPDLKYRYRDVTQTELVPWIRATQRSRK